MGKRHADALIISDGASNPIAVANAIANACREVQDDGGKTDADPAIQLMVYQLAHLTGMRVVEDLTSYSKARDHCTMVRELDFVQKG